MSEQAELLLARYGDESAVALLIKLARFVSCVKSAGHVDANALECYRKLREHYRLIAPMLGPSPHRARITRKAEGNVSVLEFCRTAYSPRVSIDSEVQRLSPDALCDSAIHLYAVTPDRQTWISRVPMSIPELFARAAPGKLNHADLAAHAHLQTLCAGELLAVKVAGRVRAALVNNRSGHFLPTYEDLEAVRSELASAIQVPEAAVLMLAVDRTHGI